MSLERTYEELKQNTAYTNQQLVLSLERTYEELKL